MAEIIISELGPLAVLAGTWEGTKGDDVAPSDDRATENNKYRERMVFSPIPPTDNHEQRLYGLRYSTTAWRLGEKDPFHEDMGYWLWDPNDSQIIKSFVIPRGIALIAGGTVMADAKKFTISSKEGSSTYGFCHNQFLEKEFKMKAFDLTITVHDESTFSYEQDTQLIIKGQSTIFHHRDKNTLTLVERPAL